MIALYRLRLHGRERMPRRGPLLVVSNHQSYFDPVLIGLLFPPTRIPAFMARTGLFVNPAFATLLRFLRAIPLRQDESDMKAIRAALERLEGGEVVALFPEGARTYDGDLREFKRGAGLLMKRSKCPLIPVAIEGAFDVWPRTRSFPRLFGQRIHVVVGEPVEHDDLLKDGADAGLERMRQAVSSLQREAAARLEATGGRGLNRRARRRARAPESADEEVLKNSQ